MLEENLNPEQAAKHNSSSKELIRLTPAILPGEMTGLTGLMGGLGNVSASQQNGASSESINVREIWRKVRKRKWLILTVVVLATVIVALESFRIKSTFQASAIVAVSKDNTAFFKENNVIVQADDTDKIKTEMLLLKTYPLQEEVARRLSLERLPLFLGIEQKNSFAQALKSIMAKMVRPLEKPSPAPAVNPIKLNEDPLAPPTPDESMRLEPYVGVLDRYLFVEQVPETRALRITYTHTDPLIAAAVANGAAHVLYSRSFETKTSLRPAPRAEGRGHPGRDDAQVASAGAGIRTGSGRLQSRQQHLFNRRQGVPHHR